MKWIGISGSWRKTNRELEKDVRKTAREIINRGDGIISGGALNVDYFATREAMKLDPKVEKIKIFLPTPLKIYSQHYCNRANEGIITKNQARELIKQLLRLQKINRGALIENNLQEVNDSAYDERNSAVINASDELIAFWVNQSEGTRNTIEKAKEKGIPIKIHKYTIK